MFVLQEMELGDFLKGIDGKDFEYLNLAPKIVDKALRLLVL